MNPRSTDYEADALTTTPSRRYNFTLLAKSNAFRLKIRESEENEKRFCDQVRVLKNR